MSTVDARGGPSGRAQALDDVGSVRWTKVGWPVGWWGQSSKGRGHQVGFLTIDLL